MIEELEKHHTNIKKILKDIRQINNSNTISCGACPSYNSSYVRLQEM